MSKWLMTVTNDNAWTLDANQAQELQKILEVDSFEELLALDPGGDAEYSGEEVAQKYVSLDQRILPKLWLEVFTDNLPQPDLLFSTSPSFLCNGLDNPSGSFVSSRLILLEISGDQSDLQLKMHLESKFTVEVHDGVDFVYDGENSDDVNDQIYECNSMANFGFSDLDLENDDGLSHNWESEQA